MQKYLITIALVVVALIIYDKVIKEQLEKTS